MTFSMSILRLPTRFRVQMALLALPVLLMHLPDLWAGRLLDDIIVLDRCETLAWSALLTEGFRFERVELGNVWWIGQDTILCYFRPLLLASFRLPMLFAGSADVLQHAISIALHLFTTGVVLALGRRIFHSPRSAFLGALLFAASLHPRWAILLITARKELLVGALVLLALYLHVRGRTWWAAVSLAGAVASGEHAVVFPFMAVAWDVLSPQRRNGIETTAQASGRTWPAWAIYIGVLVIYLGVRSIVLEGVPLPVSPYFNDPRDPSFIPYVLMKTLVTAFSLSTTFPYVGRPIIEFWLNHLWVLAICVTIIAALFVLLFSAARDRRLCVVFLILTALAYLPFVPMIALPWYLYLPSAFYALATGAALDGASLDPPRGRALHRRFLTGLVCSAVVVNIIIGMILSWGPPRPPFGPGIDSPEDLSRAIAELVKEEPLDRKLLFVDAPSPPPFFYFVHLLSAETGRDSHDLAVLTSKPRRQAPDGGMVARVDANRFRVVSPERPYFEKCMKKLLWLFPEGLIEEGRRFERAWFSVTIEAVGEPPATSDRGTRFFTTEPGIEALMVEISPDVRPPLVIGFQEQEPLILLDMAEPAQAP